MFNIRPGDIFCSENPWLIGRAINAVQAWNAPDCHAVYGHAGILLLPGGITYEALWRVKHQILHEAYAGRRVLVGRHTAMHSQKVLAGWDAVREYYGQLYPLHRLAFFMVPPLARRLNLTDWAVCSELTAKFLHGAGVMDYWSGVSPDDLADMIHNWKNWEVVFEGVLK